MNHVAEPLFFHWNNKNEAYGMKKSMNEIDLKKKPVDYGREQLIKFRNSNPWIFISVENKIFSIGNKGVHPHLLDS